MKNRTTIGLFLMELSTTPNAPLTTWLRMLLTKKYDMPSVKVAFETLKLQTNELKNKMLEMQYCNMKYNFIFSGIPEEIN